MLGETRGIHALTGMVGKRVLDPFSATPNKNHFEVTSCHGDRPCWYRRQGDFHLLKNMFPVALLLL